MASQNPRDFLADISGGKFRPAYYFFGEEDFRIIEAEKYLAHQFLPDIQLTTNYRRLDGRKAAYADVLAELSAYPMLGERQVIAVTDVQSFKPTEVDKLLGLLEPPDPNRVVVFSTPSARMPKKNSAFFKKISGSATAVEFRRLSPADMATTVRKRLEKAQLQIENEALTVLTELLAGNRGALEGEVAKIIDYKDAGETVTVEDVRKLASGYQVYEVFSLADAIVAGDRTRVLKQTRQLLADGNTATGILFFVAQHFLFLYLVRSGKSLPGNRAWLIGKFREQAPKFEPEQLERCIGLIADTDAALRRQGLPAEIALETLVLQLMGQPQD